MERLTNRERAVLDKRNSGLTFKQIAKELGLCPATVSFAYRKAYRKIEYGKAMKISKLKEYENIGSVEDLKGIHQANQRCEKILETSLMVSQNNRLLSQELEVYKRALGLTVNYICEVAKEDYNESHCPLRKFEKDYEDYRLECKCSGFQRLDDYYLDKARKEVEQYSIT